MYTTLLTALEEGILTITINRPDKLNALNSTVIEELAAVVEEIYTNEAIKAVIITGTGNKAFVAGADIAEFNKKNEVAGEALARNGQVLFSKMENCPKPIIAAVNGFALGGGCELAMACHFIVASGNAKFGQPEINLGIIPGYGGTQRLTRLINKNRATELILTGRMVDANEALQLGITNHVFEPEELLPKAKEIIQTIVAKSPLAVAKAIDCINHFDNSEQGYIYEAKKFGECFGTEDMLEGATAFLEKRKPVFKGK
jgi:enoyl-CoA hydratase